ncbi:TetR/AcrR family transcriptional regulator [Streptomyces sp. enrichment culture]|uniref:TetR/AcrR family transcriptional regulator n=1 Tax=Streptomyces sp. enrichment culture TaxID=1795815 RepID=UPI003F54F2D1
MPPAPRKRSTRDRPAKAPLSLDAVVDAALELLKTEGLKAVTMRRVAAALDTGPASLYVYVAKREDLLRAMQDRILATVALETPDPAHWREQLHALLARINQALVAHPGITATTLTEPLTTESTLRFLENMLGILLAGPIDPQDAAYAADIFTTLVTHAAIEGDVRRTDRREDAGAIREIFEALPPDRFPLITAHADRLTAGDSQQRLRVAIDVVIDGLLARAR